MKDCLDPLNDFLLQQHAAGRSNVLIIDEAQNLAPDVLEQLRLLTNLETSERKLLQIILIGQPELRAMVATPELEQLAQRVIARYHLDALSPDETRQYIAHRLAVAGLQGPLPFLRRALARVHALTGGVPRRINLLCDRALLGAYGAGLREVTDAIVRRAAREVFDAPAGPRPGLAGRWVALGMGGLVGVAALGGLAWALGWQPLARDGADPAAAPAVAASAAQAVPAASAASSALLSSAAPATLMEQPTLAQFLAIQPTDQTPAAWQALAQQWQVRLPDGAADPCAALASEGLRCYRSRRASLNLLRQLDRPVLLMLKPADGDVPGEALVPDVAVLLRSLDDRTATLEGVQGQTLQVGVSELAPLWRGEIATLWKAPTELAETSDLTATPAGAAWLDQQLAQAGVGTGRAATPAARRARIHQFQLGQGLTPDGRAGPLTLMLLNRAAGVTEPRLLSGA